MLKLCFHNMHTFGGFLLLFFYFSAVTDRLCSTLHVNIVSHAGKTSYWHLETFPYMERDSFISTNSYRVAVETWLDGSWGWDGEGWGLIHTNYRVFQTTSV